MKGNLLCLNSPGGRATALHSPVAVGVFEDTIVAPRMLVYGVRVEYRLLHGYGFLVEGPLYGCIATEQLCLHFRLHPPGRGDWLGGLCT